MSRLKLTVLILAIFGIIFGAIGMKDAIAIMREDFVDLDNTKIGDIQTGDLAKGSIYWAYDKIAIEKTTRRYGFIPMGSSETPYYLVEAGDHFAVTSVGNKDLQTKIEKCADQTLAYDKKTTKTEPTPVEVTTKVIEMPDKVRQFLKDYCKEWGMTDEDYAKLVDDSCVINCVQYDTMKMMPFIGLGAGALLLVIFFIMFFKGRKGKTVYVNDPYMPQDFNSGNNNDIQ